MFKIILLKEIKDFKPFKRLNVLLMHHLKYTLVAAFCLFFLPIK